MAGRDQSMQTGDSGPRLDAAFSRGRFGRLLLRENRSGACGNDEDGSERE